MYFRCMKHTGMGKGEDLKTKTQITAHIQGKVSLKKRNLRQRATHQGVRLPSQLPTLLSSTQKDVIGSVSLPVLQEHFTMTSTEPQGMFALPLPLGSGVCFCRNSPLLPLTAFQQASHVASFSNGT